MSSVDKEYYEYLSKLSKEDLITEVMNLESQNNEYSNENYELGRENEHIKELEDSIKVKDMLIEQLENQNDRLIGERDTYEQQLAIYKKALELACDYTESEWGNEYDPDYFLQQAKEELGGEQ